MVENKELLILKVSESKKPKQLRVTVPLENSENIDGKSYVQLIKVKTQNEE